MNRKRWVLALAAVMVVAATATTAHAVVTTLTGTVDEIVVKTSNDRWEATNAREWTPMDGVEVTLTIDEPATLVIDFAASSKCEGTVRTKCSVRARVDGTKAQPGTVIFDSDLFRWATGSADRSVDQFSARSTRWAKPVGPGEHTVHLEWRDPTSYGGATFTVQSWTLSVMTAEEG